MKKTVLMLTSILLLFSVSCKQKENESSKKGSALPVSNPFIQPSNLPFHAPDFNKIKDSDFEPAIEKGMEQQLTEVQKIANDPEPATFENTLVAMEKSGQLLQRVQNVFGLLTGANTNPELQKIQEKMAPKLAANRDAIYLNEKLFQRVSAIHNALETLDLDPESKHLVSYYYQEFVMAGAKLSEDDKAKLKKLNEEEASLRAKFTNQLLAASKDGALIVDDPAALKGLSDNAIKSASQAAKANGREGKWAIPLQNTTQQPDLQYLTERDTRRLLFEASWTRAEKGDNNDTRNTIKQIAEIRIRKANILGFPNYAAWKLQDQMAKTPKAVEDFLNQLVPPSVANAKGELSVIQALVDRQKGGFGVEPWDWNFYAEQVRKAKYDLDENEIKPYFEMDKVLEDGVFYAANQLYGITFTERTDLPVYQEDVRVFELFDTDGSSIGLFYADYYKRDNKAGGAWMGNMVNQSKLLGTKPVIYNVCNFPKPQPGEPALISFDNVTTMFHEFGHALHGFFADQEYPSLSGTNVPRDFVEFPSQFNEHWALEPSVLKHFAIHYKTGDPIPQNLFDKIKKSSNFNQGYALTELLAAAQLDMQWHILETPDAIVDVDTFEKEALRKTGLDMPQVPPRYRSSYFKHIWGSGYAAGYYAYLWSEMLDDDAYSWFVEHGGMTRENGQRFREMILSKGNTGDFKKLYRDFRGRDAKIQPLLENRGLVK